MRAFILLILLVISFKSYTADTEIRYRYPECNNLSSELKDLCTTIGERKLNTIEQIVGNLDKLIHTLVNEERMKAGLQPLRNDNEGLRTAAMTHSINLAFENINITSRKTMCTYPMIHHEGFYYGRYQSDRLKDLGLYNFSMSGENIAMIHAEPILALTTSGPKPNPICRPDLREQDFFSKLNAEPDFIKKAEIVFREIAVREELKSKQKIVDHFSIKTLTDEEIAEQSVAGWMNSHEHKKNILNPDFDETGLGITKINGVIIVTQVFMKGATCGYKNGSCCIKEGYKPYCFGPMTCNSNNICK